MRGAHVPRRWRRRALWALGVLLALWAVAWLAVPPLAKQFIEDKGSETLGRKVSIGAMDFRPWSMELTLTDIAIASADGASQQLAIKRIYVDAEMESVFRLAPVLDAITIDAPSLKLSHLGGGRYDVDDIIARLNKPPANPAPAKSDTTKPDPAPAKFSLYNLTINAGSADFSDYSGVSVGKTPRVHSLRKLHLGVPFLSNLESQRQVNVAPRLGFELNGSVFDSAAEGTPFAQSRKGDVDLTIQRLDLAPYLAYLPADLPVQLKGAVVDATLRLDFAQAKPPRVSLSGDIKVSDLKLASAGGASGSAGADILSVQTIAATLADVRPLEKVVKLSSLEIHGPALRANRNRSGKLNLDFAPSGESSSRPASTSPSSSYSSSSSNASASATTPVASAAPTWVFELARFALHQGEVAWSDDSLQPPARLGVSGLELQAHGVVWPFVGATASSAATAPTVFEGAATVPYRAKPARFSFKGEGTDQEGTVKASAADVSLALAAPYVAKYLEPTLAGVLEAQAEASWKGRQLQLVAQRVAVHDFAMVAAPSKATGDSLPAAVATNASVLATTPTAAGSGLGSGSVARGGGDRLARDMPQFKLLELTDARIDLSGKSARIARLALRAPNATLRRDGDGRWMFQDWLKPQPETPPSEPWNVALDALLVDDAVLALNDRSLSKPVRVEVSALKLEGKALTLDGKKPANLNASARVRSGRTEFGTLAYQGTAMWAPLAVQGAVQAVDLPAHAFAPYIADKLNVELLRADASFKGQLAYNALPQGPQVQVQGDMAVAEFRANSVREGGQGLLLTEELLSWKALNVPGVQVTINPGQATRVQVREASLSDFYARLIVNEAGRINLQDIVKPAAGATAAGPDVAAAAPAAAEPTAATATPAQTAAAPPADIQVGPLTMVNGRVLFSDRFIKPNYTATLSDLNGKLSQFSSQAVDGTVALADLDLRGRAEGTASLDISGKINPLAKPLALDIKGRVRDLELPPLTAYSVKYAGYGIERGKLSLDVSYTVQPNGQLTASNKLVLNQLTFGDKVDGAPNSLPVKLAVALLADRDGVIDLDLPISGSINDPQFRIGSVIWKVITNLVVKALTSPFALLSSAFGGDGSSELSTVAFAPGTSVLQPSATQGLDKVAKALTDRPALSLTVVGTANLEAEREAFKRERLAAQVLAEKRRRASAPEKVTAVATSDEDYPALLKAVYRRADIAKPRNLVGLTKDISVAEMEALLLASITVNEDNMRELALQRGVAVKDYLASRKLPLERLFLGPPKTDAADAQWTPRADLNLSSR